MSALAAVESAIADADRAKKRLSKCREKQIKKVDILDYLRSVAHAWFRSRRPALVHQVPGEILTSVDSGFQRILNATSRASARTTYLSVLKNVLEALAAVRAQILTAGPATSVSLEDNPPDFSPLASDPAMRDILTRRWHECLRCLRAEAHLAATVMMGGFLEALFIARANQMRDKSPLFRAHGAPRDGKTKQTLPLSQWTLRAYIEVGQELGWITNSGKEVAKVLRDYRNYVHPEKERSHGVTLNGHDSSMFWQLTKSLSRQLLAVQGNP